MRTRQKRMAATCALSVSAAILASSAFPDGMTLENIGTKLVLHVRPQRGMRIIYK